jgi:hypothetical protein
MSVVVEISQHLLNVFVQLANKRGLKKQKNVYSNVLLCYHGNEINKPLHSNGHVLINAHVGGSHIIKKSPIFGSN